MLCVLAALEDDQALEGFLGGTRDVTHPERTAEEAVESNGVLLTSIAVEGFRGIGAPTRLDIAPKAGLTVVVGRNGSGKSSFSEALELLLTGQTYRWSPSRSSEWREQWRNLHHPDTSASIGLIEEGVGPVTVSASWSAEASTYNDHAVVTQRAGERQVAGVEHLGWERALEQFQPILSYDELGAMLKGKPSDLYDAIAGILGVEQLSSALKRLKASIDTRKGPVTQATKSRTELRKLLAEHADERSGQALALLNKRPSDLDGLKALSTGTGGPDRGVVADLRSLLTLNLPTQADADAAVGRLRAARNALADAGAAVTQRQRDRLRLLEQGVALHGTHGDQTCPVCRQGDLDAAWAQTSRALIAREREELAGIESAHQTFELALREVRGLILAPTANLAAAPVNTVQEPLDDLRGLWQRWDDASIKQLSDSAADAEKLAAHVETSLPDLTASLELLQEVAAAAITDLDDAWQPVAGAIATWCHLMDEVAEVEPMLAQLQAAEKWLKDNDLRLKNERLAPIETHARDVWAKLRQESNVDLGGLELTGTATKRRLKVNGSVDGEAVESFAVFSQGELNALTLSLFLPRATLPESPFRFVVLDDPVQAMDPAKVDGLVEVLGEIAKSRQVVVFSHDDRLPAALRRSSLDATILEVSRGARSTVSVRPSVDPTQRYLQDANGLIKEWSDGRLSEDDLRRTLPGLYRFAVESAARERFFVAQLAAGLPLPDLEATWSDTHTTRQRVNLAIFGGQPAEHVAQKWLAPPYRKKALGVTGGGFHKGLWTDPDDAHHNVGRLVKDLREGAQ